MSLTDYTTFRVRGIPGGTTREGLQELVAEAIPSQDASGTRVRSLAVDASRPREMVATVTFADILERLADTGGKWTIGAPPDVTLTIDTHFYGWTTLYCPPADEWKYDLIAVSGLNGHAFGSFKKKEGSYMWLRDSLPGDFSGCRIMIYGYDTRLQNSTSFQSVLDIGKKFQTAVRQVRQDARKPLILLGHSLGGIVVKEAINLMRRSHIDADKLTFTAIRGVIFFGVPSQGMNISSLIPMVGDQSNRGFLHTLDHNSPVLRVQAKEFSAAIEDLRCEILNFYETQESRTAHHNVSARLARTICPENANIKKEDGTWSMSGPPAVLVGTHSATNGRPDDSPRHRVSPIDCDHSNLVKFGSAHDEPYATVTRFLQEIDDHEPPPTVAMTTTEEDCYQSLGFREQYHRMDSLEPSSNTCEWLIKHGLFIEWLKSSKGFLWIRGKPGSGKSMAMKHILKHVKPFTGSIVASFFIHGQGTELQKTILGIYRSLLHQIYPYSSESFPDLTKRFEEYTRQAGADKQDVKWSWMENEICGNFFKGLQKVCRKHRIIIMLDALDEAGEEQARMIFEDLKTLLGSMENDSACRILLCVACRHYPDISFDNGKTIVMEDLNRSDIRHVVDSRLAADNILDDSERQQLKSDILKKSEGVFQWASLVTETVIRMRQKGDSFTVAMKNLNHVPKTLDLLYNTILETKDEQEHELKQRARLFQWVALAEQPLTPKLLQHTLALHSSMIYRSVREYKQSDYFIAAKDFDTKIKNLSKGLIQIKGSFRNGRAEFIHQSILDFLLGNRGRKFLSKSPVPNPIGLGHFELSISCLKYLFLEEVHHSLPRSRPEHPILPLHPPIVRIWTDQFPFILYAWRNWVFHGVSGKEMMNNREGESNKEEELYEAKVREAFSWPGDQQILEPWARIAEYFGSPLDTWIRHFRPFLSLDGPDIDDSPMWPCQNARLIHLFAATGLLGPSSQRKMSSDLDSRARPDEDGFVTPLGYALLGHQKDVVQQLIAAGVHVQCKTGTFGRSPLYLASTWGDPAMVSSLLESGLKINHLRGNGWTPLHAAARTGQVAVMGILIDNGANVNYQCRRFLFSRNRSDSEHYLCPLHLAALNGKVEAVRYLIHKGADVNSKSLGRQISPLFSAILGETLDTTALLLGHGADVHARDSFGNSSMHYVFYVAVENVVWSVMTWEQTANITPERLNILRRLIELGCNVNAKNELGVTPLHLSTSGNSIELLKLLLHHGADPNAGTRLGETPLHEAARRSTEATKAILDAKANVNLESCAPHPWSTGFPIHLAAASGDPTRVQLLIQRGSKVDVVNCRGDTPLGLAMQPSGGSKVQVIQLLLDAGSNVNLASRGKTPLRLAIDLRSETDVRGQVIKLLLAAGVSPSIMRDEIYAADSRPSVRKVLELLVEAGMKVNTRDEDGETALFWVIRSQKLSKREEEQQKMDGVELLLRSGADPSITNRIGRTALSYATRNGDSRVAQLLREHKSPEGVWRRHTKVSFVAEGVDELTGKLSRFFKRDRPWYAYAVRKFVRPIRDAYSHVRLLWLSRTTPKRRQLAFIYRRDVSSGSTEGSLSSESEESLSTSSEGTVPV